MRRASLALGFALALTAASLSCSSDERSSTQPASIGSGGSSSSGGSSAGGSSAAAAGSGASGGGTVAAGGAGGAGGGPSAGAGGSGVSVEFGLSALGANRSVGLEWDPVANASGYKLYFQAGASATTSSSVIEIEASRATYVHRALDNGTTYHYLISAVVAGSESQPSPDISATPGGEWTLEEFGSGLFEDITTGESVPRVPLEKRVQVLLFAEGYTAADLEIFHADADHDSDRQGDVDGWIDDVFAIEPYASFREAFVVWFLPRASNTHFDGGDTAFAVPTSGPPLATATIPTDGETAALAWEALGQLPVAATDFSGGGFGNLRTHVAAFLLFDPDLERASLSGRATSLRNPADDSQRIAAAFGVGHAHEFSHAFSGVRDEYIENDNPPVSGWDDLSNVVGTNVCGELPWAHLLEGGDVNASQAELVGAFGVQAHGFHSELLCLMNGTHDNAEYYGGNGLLRSNDRFCNYCRELTMFRIYGRSSLLDNDTTGYEEWKLDYREKFYARFPFAVPAVVPQTNNVGETHYDACVAALQFSEARVVSPPSGPQVYGCVTEDP